MKNLHSSVKTTNKIYEPCPKVLRNDNTEKRYISNYNCILLVNKYLKVDIGIY